MSRQLVAALFAAMIVLVAPAPPARADDGATLTDVTVEGERLAFTVTVTGVAAGRSLISRATQVTVGGEPAGVRVSESGGQDARVATAILVVDTSGSMGPDGIAAAKQAATAFARASSAEVRIGLIGFSDRPRLIVAPTTDRARLATGIATLAPQGETSLYDAVVLAAGTAGRGGSVVILSDGADTVSQASLAQTIGRVRATGASLNAVAFRTSDSSSQPLRQLAGAGGGRVVAASGTAALAAAFANAAAGVPVRQRVEVQLPADSGGLPLQVSVGDGKATWSASGAVPALPAVVGALPSAPAQASGVVVAAPPWYGSVWPVAGLVGLALALIGWLAMPRPQNPSLRRERALAVYGVNRGVRNATPAQEAAKASAATGIVDLSERLVHGRSSTTRMAERLDRAGSRLRPAEWLVIQVSACLAIAAVVAVLGRSLLAGALVGVLGGWLGTFLWLRIRQTRRVNAFADAMPDTLQLVASSLRTGFSLPQALDAAQQDGVQPMAEELGRALAAARIGAPLEDELEAIAHRMDNEDWRWAVMAIRIQRSVGGNLAEVLLTTVRTLRERAASRRQVRALSAEGRLSAYILIALPILVAAILFMFRREYVSLLWSSLPGVIMIFFAVVMMLVGSFWMSKVVKVEV